jgi:uncharacterized membrane protein YqhA
MNMLRRVLAGSRYFIVIGVVGSFLASITLLIYGGLKTISLIISTFAGSDFSQTSAKYVAVGFIEILDLFLLGTVLYIIALGLYQLFIDDKLPLPAWLHLHSLTDLKVELINVIIVLLGVSFLGAVVQWDGSSNILALGLGIGAILAAYALLLRSGGRLSGDNSHEHEQSQKPEE